MEAYDYRTGVVENASYTAYESSRFVPYAGGNSSGYESSLLLEWYHAAPYFCSQDKVIFSNSVNPEKMGWMNIDEWNYTGVPFSQLGNASYSKTPFVFRTNYFAYYYNSSERLQSFTVNGTRIYSNSTMFVV